MKPALSPLSEGSTAQFAILVLAFIVFPYAGFLYLIVADAGLFRTVVAPLARKPGIDPFENGLLPCEVAPVVVSYPIGAPAFKTVAEGAGPLSTTEYSPPGVLCLICVAICDSFETNF